MASEVRIDKWLWAVRIFKTRSIAADAIKMGRVTIGGQKVKASRNVILVNGDRSAKCDEAVYTKADGKVVMTGREVQVQRAKDQMTGTRITIWLNDERVECEPARMVLQESTVNSGKGGAGNILPK